MRLPVTALLLILFLTPAAYAQEDPPAIGERVPVADAPWPRTIDEARVMALGSPFDAKETARLLDAIEADVLSGEMLWRASSRAEDLGTPALERLMRLVKTHESTRVQSAALYATWKIKPRVMRSPAGVAALGTMLDWLETAPDDDELLLDAGAGIRPSFEAAGPTAEALLPRLAKLAQHDVAGVRRIAVGSLSMLGRFARSQTDVLIAALQDSDGDTRIHALHALGGRRDLGPDLAEKLAAAGDHSDPDVRRYARLLAGHQRLVQRRLAAEPSAPAYPELKDGVTFWGITEEDYEPETGEGEEWVPPPEPPPLPPAIGVRDLVLLVGDTDKGAEVERRLTALGPRIREALPALVLHLDDPDRTRAPSVRLLAVIGGDDPQVIEELIAVVGGLCPSRNMSHHAPESLEAHAAQALGRIGPAAKAALPALRLAALAMDEELRLSAEAAIADIDVD